MVDSVQTYLREINRIRLLTHEEEIFLGKQIQSRMKLLRINASLTEELGRELSAAEWAQKAGLSVEELTQRLDQGQQAKDRMTTANLRLVVSIAKKYLNRGLEFLDLIQEGNLGLKRGVEKFDPTRGCRFCTHAYWWIRQEITLAIAQQASQIRLPVNITRAINKIKQVQSRLFQELGRGPTVAEVARELDWNEEELKRYLAISCRPISLNTKVGDNQDADLMELLESDVPTPEEHLVNHALQEGVAKLLESLKPKERQVLVLRFGLANGNPLSLRKVGGCLKLNASRVQQLERQALIHLRLNRGDAWALVPH